MIAYIVIRLSNIQLLHFVLTTLLRLSSFSWGKDAAKISLVSLGSSRTSRRIWVVVSDDDDDDVGREEEDGDNAPFSSTFSSSIGSVVPVIETGHDDVTPTGACSLQVDDDDDDDFTSSSW